MNVETAMLILVVPALLAELIRIRYPKQVTFRLMIWNLTAFLSGLIALTALLSQGNILVILFCTLGAVILTVTNWLEYQIYKQPKDNT